MKDTEKYLIHATIAADGVVERSDVVGAVFGQTEGLLGDELDLRDLQESSRVGRIDVSVESENGQSFGEVTVASSLDKVETAILGAAFETIDRIGPCHASVEVTSIEDVRAAKRRQVVERAKELVAGGFEETSLGSTDVLEEVRDAARVEGIVDYDGLPAGPRVGDSDAVIVVEGRADVLTLLDCGIKNAVAVEGTNVPDAVADLTADRTVTAFLDGDRGGELILRELAQVGDVDYVAFAPAGESVEDLDRDAVFEALRGKVPYTTLADAADVRAAADGTDRDETESTVGRDARRQTEGVGNDGTVTEAVTRSDVVDGLGDEADGTAAETGAVDGDEVQATVEAVDGDTSQATAEVTDGDEREADNDADRAVTDPDGADAGDADSGDADSGDADAAGTDAAAADTDDADSDGEDDTEPRSMAAHVRVVVGGRTGRARLLDDEFDVIAEVDAGDAVDAVDDAAAAPHAVVVDGDVGQRLLDAAVQRDVTDIVGRGRGEFVKRPVGTRVLTAADLRAGS